MLRGGYSIAYNRQGIGDFRGIFGSNPGVTITTNRDMVIGNLATELPVLLRDLGATNRLAPPDFPKTPTYPLTGPPYVALTNSANIIDPNIKVPYSQSWTFGIQREITKNMAIEVRYVGTRNLQGWTTYDLNDVENNVLENGLLNEFRLAQANLRANRAKTPGMNTFAYTGTGTSPLPITLAYLGSYSSPNFSSTAFLNSLALNNPNLCCSTTTSYAGLLDNNATFRDNAIKAGLPLNFMRTNPNLRGGANYTGNGGYTRYDGLQVEVRRRLSNGLELGGNYQFAKSFSSTRVSFRTARVNTLNDTVLRHAVKVHWNFELPFGNGKMLFGNIGNRLNKVIGGWEFHGAGRVQSGQLFDFGSVNLVGMTMKTCRRLINCASTISRKITYLLPRDIIENTIKAFNTSATSTTGYSTGGPPAGAISRPPRGELHPGLRLANAPRRTSM